MIRVIFAEWRKLRRPTLFLGTIGAALFFTGLTSTFLYLMIDSEQGNSDRGRQVSREVLELAGGSVYGFASVGGLLGIIALCVFAAQTAQEYTYGTLRNLLVRQPGRIRILVGKLIAMKIFALVMIAISAVVSIGISYFLSDRAKVNTIGVLWILIIENLLGAVKPVFLEWMPGNQLSLIAQGGSSEISYMHALTLGSSYVFVGAIVATVLFTRRDVAN